MESSKLKNSPDEFKSWFETVKENAIEDFGFTVDETNNFSEKNWKQFYEQGLTPFESVVQQLKNKFNFHNG